MKHLIEGVRRFQDLAYPPMRSLFENLAGGQKPHTLFITCADSRIDPALITQSDPGEIFVHRSPRNLVPEFGDATTSEAASIEYAVQVLGVADIVVCGHSQCGAVAGLANPESIWGLDHVANWLEHANEATRAAKHFERDFDDSLTVLSGGNVVAQLDNLLGCPFVKERVASKSLSLHGWVYVIETGDICVYQWSVNRFVSLGSLEE